MHAGLQLGAGGYVVYRTDPRTDPFCLPDAFCLACLVFKRALAIHEKALAAEHLDVAIRLDNYAALLKKTGRTEDAVPLESRARAIRVKHSARDWKAHGPSAGNNLFDIV